MYSFSITSGAIRSISSIFTIWIGLFSKCSWLLSSPKALVKICRSFWNILHHINGYGWDCFVYEPNSYYISAIMREFYEGCAKSDISRDDISFTLKWQDHTINIHAGTIYEVTEYYITMMSLNSTITRNRRISGTIIYRNIYATYCWIHHNMIGVLHILLLHHLITHRRLHDN